MNLFIMVASCCWFNSLWFPWDETPWSGPMVCLVYHPRNVGKYSRVSMLSFQVKKNKIYISKKFDYCSLSYMWNIISLSHIDVDSWKYSMVFHAFILGKKRKRSLSYMCNTISLGYIDAYSWPIFVGDSYCFPSCYGGSQKPN